MSRPGPGFTLTWAMLSIHTGVVLGASWIDASNGLPGTVVGVLAMVIDRASGSTLYAQTSGGGVFKSTDSGANWKALGNVAGVQALALDPTSALTIYAGSARGVFKSTNGGDSWSTAGLAGKPVNILAIDPVTPLTLYSYGIGDNIYKSTDGGGSWTGHALGLPTSPPYGAVSSIFLDPLTPSTLYATAILGPRSAMYKSTDAGESWSVVNPGPFARLLAIDPVTSSTLYAIQEFGTGFSKSTDGGASWTPTGFTKDVLALAVDPKNPNILYASTYAQARPDSFPGGQAIYKSLDGGNTWDTVNTSLPPAGSLVFSPLNSSTVYAVTFSGGVFKSADAGTTWNATNSGLRALGIRVLVGDPVDPATVYAGGDFGLFKTIDSGGSWNQEAVFQITCCTLPPGTFPPGAPSQMPPFPPVAPASIDSLLIDFTNPNIQYVGTLRTDGCFFADILIFKSTDGGANWSNGVNPMQSGCLASGLMGMDPTDPNTLYLRWGDSFDGLGMRKSTDGGATWNFTGLSGYIQSVLVIDPRNPMTLYAGTDNGVKQSTDGGAKWNITGLAKANVNLLAIDPHQPNVLYAATTGVSYPYTLLEGENEMFRARDNRGEVRWTTHATVYPDSPGFRSLFKSTDSGATWSPINEGLGDLLDNHASFNALVLDPDHTDVLYVATSGYAIFRSSDGGATWAPFNDGLTYLDVRLLTVARGVFTSIYAGTPGGVFKIVDDGR
jgi:photosystem II stability/assembly factor-like uncharacterized protein